MQGRHNNPWTLANQREYDTGRDFGLSRQELSSVIHISGVVLGWCSVHRAMHPQSIAAHKSLGFYARTQCHPCRLALSQCMSLPCTQINKPIIHQPSVTWLVVQATPGSHLAVHGQLAQHRQLASDGLQAHRLQRAVHGEDLVGGAGGEGDHIVGDTLYCVYFPDP